MNAKFLATVVTALGLTIGSATAQSESEFVSALSGEWMPIEPHFSARGAVCKITFQTEAVENVYSASVEGCVRDLATAARWGIVNQQLALLDSSGAVLSTFGGDQSQLNGETVVGNAVVLVRPTGEGGLPDRPCVYLGYTSTCADREDVSAPFLDPERDDEGGVNAEVLVRLNARSGSASDAPVVAILEPNACVRINQCKAGPEGIWCRIERNSQDVWLKKQSVRLEQFPVVTFKSGCQ